MFEKTPLLQSIGALLAASLLSVALSACSNSNAQPAPRQSATADSPKVYFTSEISPEALVRIYDSLGVVLDGPVAVKISTGEGNSNYLRPELISQLVSKVNGTIVECCTAYGGQRMDPAEHWKTIHEHGFDAIAPVDLMDEFGEIMIPVRDSSHIRYDIVGEHLKNYRSMINLAHFKGHAMGGFGGVLKNASIGVASTSGKVYIHSAGRTKKSFIKAVVSAKQDHFLESMAAAAQAVHDYMGGRVVYINVMNNMSVDCDCDAHPAEPRLKDMGIAASLDPVAVDQACLDMVFSHHATEGDDNKPLMKRINSRHGTHTVDHAERIGLGSRAYQLVTLSNDHI